MIAKSRIQWHGQIVKSSLAKESITFPIFPPFVGGILKNFYENYEILIALHCLGCITANNVLPPSRTSPGLEFLNFCNCEMPCYHLCRKATSYWAIWSGKHVWCPLSSTDTDKNRGEGSRLMLAALWQPVPWNMPYSIFSTWIRFSAAHTLQQQRGGEALDSVQLQLFKKKKTGGSLVSDELGSLQRCWLGALSRAGALEGHHKAGEVSLHWSTSSWTGPTDTSSS